MLNYRKIVGCELIGLILEVIDAKNKSLIGLKGKVVDETKNTITIEINNKEKKILKNQVTLKIPIDDQMYEVDGKLLVGRPENRLKKRIK